MRIPPTPLLRPIFERLKELEEVIPPELMRGVHQNLLSHLKLNLAGLSDRRITDEMLAAVVRPFMQEVEEVHTTIVKKIWRDVILPCGAILITLGLLLLLGWALKMGKLYAMRKYVERFKRKNEETATATELKLSSIDAAQEEGGLQQENAKKSAPQNSRREKLSPKSCCQKTSQPTPPLKRKIYLVLILSLYDVALMIPLVFIALLRKRHMRTSTIDEYSNVYHQFLFSTWTN